MKELKLRAWDKVRHKMVKPLAITFDTQSFEPFALSVPGRTWEPIHKYELSESTGLADLNGLEVYQGDFILITAELFLVIWNKEIASFELQNVKSKSKRKITDISLGEVTGNQFENSELLK